MEVENLYVEFANEILKMENILGRKIKEFDGDFAIKSSIGNYLESKHFHVVFSENIETEVSQSTVPSVSK